MDLTAVREEAELSFMITEETVLHVAKLARLELTPEETHRYAQELSKILHLVDELADLDLSSSTLELVPEHPTLFREDKQTWNFDRQDLLSNTPEEENGFFRVPKILDEGN